MFAGIEEVTVKERSSYFEAGNYVGVIQAVKQGRTNQEDKPYFVAEFKLVESDNPNLRVGSLVAWMTMLNKYKRYFLEEVKGFVAAATDSAPEDVTEEVVEFVTGEDQPLVGNFMRIDCREEVNRNSGKAFVKSSFQLAKDYEA